MAENIRVLMAKVGLDGHDRGVRVVARCLRDAGMDVVYTGLHRTPEEVVDAAVQEDVDVLGVSLLSGAHMTAFPRIMKRLKERGVNDIILLGGGVIPDEDVVALKKLGVAEILLQDTPPNVIVDTVRRLVREHHALRDLQSQAACGKPALRKRRLDPFHAKERRLVEFLYPLRPATAAGAVSRGQSGGASRSSMWRAMQGSLMGVSKRLGGRGTS